MAMLAAGNRRRAVDFVIGIGSVALSLFSIGFVRKPVPTFRSDALRRKPLAFRRFRPLIASPDQRAAGDALQPFPVMENELQIAVG
jgi:hypothetical protein